MPSPKNLEAGATARAKRTAQLWPLVSGITLIGLAFTLGALIIVRSNGMPLWLDTRWVNELDQNRAPVWEALSLLMNALGGGLLATIIVPGGIVAVLLVMKRPWAAGYFLGASIFTGAAVQLLKHLFGRARPGSLTVNVDFGSFPSGHVANAAIISTALALIVPRLWVWAAGSVYTVVMMISRTYLGAHWLSDTIGGLMLAIGVGVVMWAPLAAKVGGERTVQSKRFANALRLQAGAPSPDEAIDAVGDQANPHRAQDEGSSGKLS